MRRQPAWMSLVVVLGWLALSAQDLAKPAFEVASVRQRAPSSDGRIPVMQCIGGPGSPDPERLSCTNAPLAMLICIAYGVQYYQVAGPEWMSTDGYDISAKIPPSTTQAQYKLMLQALLAERFHLALHHESRGRTAYSLLVAKGGNKMQVSAPPNRASGRNRSAVCVDHQRRRLSDSRNREWSDHPATCGLSLNQTRRRWSGRE